MLSATWDPELDDGGPASPEAIVTAVRGLLHAQRA
jgi:hypothetical protein